MDTLPPSGSLTYRHGFLDFLTAMPTQDHRLAGYELQPAGLACFNAALNAISPESPPLNLGQIAAAGQRALERCPDGGQPAFIASRLALLARLQAMVDDSGWEASDELRARVQVLNTYMTDPGALFPSRLAVIGNLDDALLIDVALQVVRDELSEFEDFCRFRSIVAEREGIAADSVRISREQWLQARACPDPMGCRQ